MDSAVWENCIFLEPWITCEMSGFAVHDVQMQSLRSGIKLEPVISQQYSFLYKTEMERHNSFSVLIVSLFGFPLFWL